MLAMSVTIWKRKVWQALKEGKGIEKLTKAMTDSLNNHDKKGWHYKKCIKYKKIDDFTLSLQYFIVIYCNILL